jgi:hypothetical protein
MPLLVHCEQCHRQLRVPDGAVGQTVRCPARRAAFAVRPEAAPPALVAPVDEPPAAQPAPAGPPPLPEAVRAARPGPPPLPPDAIQGPPVPRPVPPPLPASEPAQVRPARPARRHSFVPLRFPVLVQADPDRVLKGRLDAEVSADGLSLRQGKKLDVELPVGTRARYLGKNQFAVSVDDRDVTLAAVPPRQYQHRLARDVVDFLRGERASLRAQDYRLPVGLYVATLVPVSVVFLAIVWRAPWAEGRWGVWGGIWGAVGGALSGAAFALAQRERLATGLRVAAALGLGVVAYTAYFLTLGLSGGLGGPSVPASAWKEFAPAEGRFRVEMPGTPVFRAQEVPGGPRLNTWIVEFKRPDMAFAVEYGDIPRDN